MARTDTRSSRRNLPVSRWLRASSPEPTPCAPERHNARQRRLSDMEEGALRPGRHPRRRKGRLPPHPPPSTLCSAAFAMARLPRSRSASVPAALRMLPPLRLSASAATLMPSASLSAACTT